MTTNARNKEYIPHKATHPGVLIADELEAREDMNQKDLARLLEVKPSFLNEIIKGKRPVTAETAVLLEKAMGIPAKFWQDMQSQYDLDMARIKDRTQEKVKNIEIWDAIKNLIPVSAFKKLGYITANVSDDISKIFEIYDVSLVDEFFAHLAQKKAQMYRKSEKLTTDDISLFAWSAVAEYECKKLKTGVFDLSKIDDLCTRLNKVFFENNDVLSKTEALLKEYGIKFIVLEKFNKTPVDGYCFWSGENPAIVMTKRHNRIDNFAFTLMHEIGHIVLHLQKDKESLIIETKKDSENVREKEADDFARNNLISPKVWKEIKIQKFPMKDSVIEGFAEQYNINSRIIFGRMCYESNNYMVKTGIDSKIN